MQKKIYDTAKVFYEKRQNLIGPEKTRQIEQIIMLSVIDANWKDYLFNMDQLREGISWRAYGQRDPLVEYQHEAFAMFTNLLRMVDEEITERLFKTHAIEEGFEMGVFKKEKEEFIHEEYSALGPAVSQPDTAIPPSTPPSLPQETYKRKVPKVGRNDPCPCGSGKKYKKCCGR